MNNNKPHIMLDLDDVMVTSKQYFGKYHPIIKNPGYEFKRNTKIDKKYRGRYYLCSSKFIRKQSNFDTFE